jgi:hypothetical protein
MTGNRRLDRFKTVNHEWRESMKKQLLILALAGLLPAMGITKSNPAADAKSKTTVMDAWISDEKCGANVDPACAKKCMEQGSKLVVVNTTDKSVIPVSNQEAVKPFVGQHVTVKGTMQNGVLAVESVKPLASEKK